MHQRTKWHSNQGTTKIIGDYIEECIKGRNGTVIKAGQQRNRKEITLKNASKEEMAQ